MKERVPTIPITIHLPVAEVERIEDTARQAKQSRASWCRDALRAALAPVARAVESNT